MQLFQELTNTLIPLLQTLPTHHGLQETLTPVIARSLSETIDSIESPSDSKPITAWKNSWLETDTSGWVLKESIKQEDGRGILDLYRAYEYAMQQAGRIDFSDMILQAIHLIESDEIVAATLAEQYQWVMIDEYQDTNDAQLRLITSMLRVSPEQPNLFAVGDDDQSIYKFQ